MKFLIIRFSSIGDIVLTTPVIRCLKKQVATAEVHYLSKASFKPILAHNPYIDKLYCVDNDLDSIIGQLKAEDYDYIIDLHHNVRTLKVKRALQKKSIFFSQIECRKMAIDCFENKQASAGSYCGSIPGNGEWFRREKRSAWIRLLYP